MSSNNEWVLPTWAATNKLPMQVSELEQMWWRRGGVEPPVQKKWPKNVLQVYPAFWSHSTGPNRRGTVELNPMVLVLHYRRTEGSNPAALRLISPRQV